MKNKLTEQYRKGTLPGGFYYFKNKAGDTYAVDYHNLAVKGSEDVEVLTEVYAYDEYIMLKKQLEIALETLGQIAMFSKDTVDAVQAAKAICDIEEAK